MDYLEFLYYGKGNISRIYEVCKVLYVPINQTILCQVIIKELMKNLVCSCCCHLVLMEGST